MSASKKQKISGEAENEVPPGVNVPTEAPTSGAAFIKLSTVHRVSSVETALALTLQYERELATARASMVAAKKQVADCKKALKVAEATLSAASTTSKLLEGRLLQTRADSSSDEVRLLTALSGGFTIEASINDMLTLNSPTIATAAQRWASSTSICPAFLCLFNGLASRSWAASVDQLSALRILSAPLLSSPQHLRIPSMAAALIGSGIMTQQPQA